VLEVVALLALLLFLKLVLQPSQRDWTHAQQKTV
jgi:hypothetical protein